MKRRDFIRTTCFASLAITGSCFLLTDCKTASITESNGEAIIPLSEFKKTKTVIFSSKSFMQKIIVVQEADKTYKSFLLKCTHKGADLELKDEMLICPAHGSRFDLEGNVTNIPANKPLKSFPVTVRGKNVVVQLT